jgi:predicted NUDIX family NTP pyrophosphohydrolase
MNADDPEIQAPGRGGAPRPASAGMLLFRRGPGGGDIEVLLVHPGGPFWANKDAHAWSIPKGEIGPDESPLAAALRELAEETGCSLAPAATNPVGSLGPDSAIVLPPVRAGGGKVIHAFAVEHDFEVGAALRSNTFELEWPPRSGKRQSFPEVDRAAWFPVDVARTKLHKGQVVLVDHLLASLRP